MLTMGAVIQASREQKPLDGGPAVAEEVGIKPGLRVESITSLPYVLLAGIEPHGGT